MNATCAVGTSNFSPISNFTTLPMRTGEIKATIDIYPIPAMDNFYIDISNVISDDNFLVIGIYDIVGNLVYSNGIQFSGDSFNQAIALDKCSNGIYFIHLDLNHDRIEKKVIIAK